jgi:hypothetical protein
MGSRGRFVSGQRLGLFQRFRGRGEVASLFADGGVDDIARDAAQPGPQLRGFA